MINKPFWLVRNIKTGKYVYRKWSKNKREYVLKESNDIKKVIKYVIAVFGSKEIADRAVEWLKNCEDIDATAVEIETVIEYKEK